MTMDASAIERIEQLVAATKKPDTDIPAMVMPEKTGVVSLEKYQRTPYHMRQRYQTERIIDFTRYVGEEENENTVVYVAPNGDIAEAIIDHGTHDDPEWGHHRATLALVKTPAYRALENLCQQPRTQQQLIDYIEDWGKRGFMECLINGEPVDATSAMGAIRRVDISAKATSSHEQDDFRASRTAMEEIEAKAADGTMPQYLRLVSPLYVGTEPRDIHVRIGITPIDDEPAFRLRMMQVERLQEEVAAEVEDRMHQSLGCKVYVGTVSR